jgi:hypothetical protein
MTGFNPLDQKLQLRPVHLARVYAAPIADKATSLQALLSRFILHLLLLNVNILGIYAWLGF